MDRTELVNHLLLNSKKNLSEISSKIGVNRSNLYLWQKGKTKPSISNINNLADFLGVKLNWISKNEIELNNVSEYEKSIETKSYDRDIIFTNQQEIIEYQKEKIHNLENKIKTLEEHNRHNLLLDKEKCTFNLYTSLQFKTNIDKNNITDNILQSTKRIIEGNTISLGYSNDELSEMSAKEFMMLYHPESIKDSLKTMYILSENSNTIVSLSGIRLLKSKLGHWITFNCKMYWERDPNNQLNWLLNAYYTELNPSDS